MEQNTTEAPVLANAEEVKCMPVVELVERETVSYIKGMEAYLQELKSMPDGEAVRKSKLNLQKSHIIQEDGEFTERYRYSRMYAR